MSREFFPFYDCSLKPLEIAIRLRDNVTGNVTDNMEKQCDT